ncbi:growth arrest and DNA damage-inducible protein GADD45 alpha-like isoform X2 [Tachypleus tridentatus]|uniref:growth arrest and DNA damage-inducible protein GADD45 alpha-like isoform X2 n=1 Tax=Tachypleus tridentatus TaxID=6853 RepID=UPI003FD16A42
MVRKEVSLASQSQMIVEDHSLQEQMLSNTSQDSPGHVLEKLISEAAEKRRIVCGVYQAAQLLEKHPSRVMVCILPGDIEDVEVHIHSLLIQAFCYENKIRLVKVDSESKLASIISAKIGVVSPTSKIPVNFHCVIIKNVTEKMPDIFEAWEC